MTHGRRPILSNAEQAHQKCSQFQKHDNSAAANLSPNGTKSLLSYLNNAIGEPSLTRFTECPQTTEVAGLHRRGCFDFDPHDHPVIAFQHVINFAQLLVSNMINRV